MFKGLTRNFALFSVFLLVGYVFPETAFSKDLTPEDVGATPESHRNDPCEYLTLVVKEYQKQQAAEPGVKMWRWQVDAITQVIAEKKCNAAAASNPAAVPQAPIATQTGSSKPVERIVSVYGYCSYASVKDRAYWITTVFEVFHSSEYDLKKEFDIFLRSNNETGLGSMCVIRDSHAQATSDQKKEKGMFGLSAKIIEVSWAPAR